MQLRKSYCSKICCLCQIKVSAPQKMARMSWILARKTKMLSLIDNSRERFTYCSERKTYRCCNPCFRKWPDKRIRNIHWEYAGGSWENFRLIIADITDTDYRHYWRELPTLQSKKCSLIFNIGEHFGMRIQTTIKKPRNLHLIKKRLI